MSSQKLGVPEVFAAERTAGPDLWRLLWQWKWLLLVGLVLGVGLGSLYYTQSSPVYESTARLLVTRRRPAVPFGSDLAYEAAMLYQQSALATQAAIIRSPVIIRHAIEGNVASIDEDLQRLVDDIDAELGRESAEVIADSQRVRLTSLPTLANREPVSVILRGLKVEPSLNSSDVLDISYRGLDAADSQKILSSVIRSYQSHLKGARDVVTQQTSELIADAKDELSEQLNRKRTALRDFQSTHGHLLYRDGEGQNIHFQRMSVIEEQRSELAIQAAQLTAQHKAIELAVVGDRIHEALLMLTNQDIDLRSPAQIQRESIALQMLPLMLEEMRLSERYGPDHPDVVSLRKRMELSRDVLEEVDTALGEQVEEPVDPRERLAVHVGALEQRIAALRLEDDRLAAMFEEKEQAAKETAQLEAQESAFRDDIARTEELYNVVVKRLSEINLVEDLGGYDAAVISAPNYGYKVEPSLVRVFCVSLFLGGVGAFGLAYFIELTDRSFRSAEDIQSTLGIPLVGHVPVMEARKLAKAAQGSSLDPTLVAVHKPTSPLAEAYRAVRTALYFGTRGQGHQVIQVTSPTPGDGKTTLAANLAITIAQSNKQVLLLDADCRRPRIHKMLDLERRPGLASIIDGGVDVADAIGKCAIENLHVLTAGAPTENPSELITSPRFAELIDQVREKFEFVIIDSPPMLAVTDSSAVAARADGVLLTMRMTKHSRGTAVRTAEMLDSLNANVLGLVVNGVGRKQGYGYGSGSYKGYGYAYGSAYGYGVYGENGAGKYYQPDPEEAEKA